METTHLFPMSATLEKKRNAALEATGGNEEGATALLEIIEYVSTHTPEWIEYGLGPIHLLEILHIGVGDIATLIDTVSEKNVCTAWFIIRAVYFELINPQTLSKVISEKKALKLNRKKILLEFAKIRERGMYLEVTNRKTLKREKIKVDLQL